MPTTFIVGSTAKVSKCVENTGKGIFLQGHSLLAERAVSLCHHCCFGTYSAGFSYTPYPHCSQDIVPVFRDLPASGSRLPIAEAEW